MGETENGVRNSFFEVCYAGNNSGVKGLVLHVLWGGRALLTWRSAEQGGLGEGYGRMPRRTAYNMFKEGDTRREEQSLSMRTRLKSGRNGGQR